MTSMPLENLPGIQHDHPKSTLLHKLLWGFVPYNLLCMVIALIDFIQHPAALSPYAPFGGAAWFRAFCILVSPLYLLLTYQVLKRSPNNLIGLMMFAFSGGAVSFGISVDIAPVLYNIVSLPISLWWTLIILLPLYFADGKPFPRRLSGYLTFLFYFSLLCGVAMQTSAPIMTLSGNLPNPWFIPALSDFNSAVISIYFLCLLPLLPLVFVSPYLRYRRADYQQRQQLKWLMLFGGAFVPYLVMYMGAGFLYGSRGLQSPVWVMIVYNLYLVYIILFPGLAVGNAILRHKLYDIDIIIRRTLIYTVLTTILGIVYFGGIILTQQAFKALTGQTSDLAIVVSTLLIAALFAPLRRRVQDGIDRRLYRKKYDVEKVLADFQKNLRDEVDMETLKANLIGVVSETMQPDKIALWVRSSSQPERK